MRLEMLFDIVNINTADGTSLVTGTAAGALIIVNPCTEVFNGYCTLGAYLGTLHTADTACLTLLSCLGALCVVLTKNCSLCSIKGEQINKLSGTGLDTLFTSTAFIGVDSCNTVTDENCIIRTNLNAITEADTAVYTVLWAAEKLCCNFAGVNSVIFQLFFNIHFVALAHNGSNHRCNTASFKAHNRCNCLSGIVAAGGTEVTLLGFAL